MHIHFSGPDEILDQLIARYPALVPARESIQSAFGILSDCFADGNKLLLCGNGGSAADALHIAGELMKSFVLPRKPDAAFQEALFKLFPGDAPFLTEKLERALPAVALVGNPAVCTAVQNDTAAKTVFAQQVYGLGTQNDVLFGISTSGNSENVVLAAETAKALGMRVITLTGRGPNRLTAVSDCQIAVDGEETFRVQELHLPVYHALCLMLEDRFFSE
ncbi:MAG: SIS domain-containing protein [Clostridiales bacterium]|nr:SIS domain-containing protein [Clostridiales bacterium]